MSGQRTPMPPPPRAVLFDWDNTLVDTWPCIHGALNATFRAMGKPEWTFEEFRAQLGPSMRDSFPIHFGERWETARDIFYAAFAETHLGMLKVQPGAPELLQGLSEAGIHLGVVSNKTGEHLRRESDHLGWSRYFGRLVGALDASRDKPAPEPVTLALEGTGLVPGDHVWLIGDSLIDLECAHASGCLPVLLRAAPPDGEEFQRWPPRLHVADCHAALTVISQLLVPSNHF